MQPSTDIHWLQARADDVPEHDDWLGRREFTVLGKLVIHKRREDWRLGRWVAKNCVAAHLDLPLSLGTFAEIEILPGQSGAPEVLLSGIRAPASISLSHRAGVAMCAIAPLWLSVGCDLELLEPRSTAFVSDYLTDDEQFLVSPLREPERSCVVNLLWSCKESALKVLKQGLNFDTRDVRVSISANGRNAAEWNTFQANFAEEESFAGWWQRDGTMIRTIATLARTATGAPRVIEARTSSGAAKAAQMS